MNTGTAATAATKQQTPTFPLPQKNGKASVQVPLGTSIPRSHRSVKIRLGDEKGESVSMTMDTKKGGLLPATQTISLDGRKTVSSLGSGNPFALLCIAAKRTPDADYSTDWRHAPHDATIPTYWKGVLVEWITPEAQHTDDAPFCAVMACQCHHDAVRMERYFIGPVSRGDMEIAEALDLFHAEAGYMARKQAEACAREAVAV